MEYNSKIDINGKYRKFEGWSVISNLKNDFTFIENYIKMNNILSRYFSALPSKSYHMTLYNLWCDGAPLIPHQLKYIKKNPIVPKNIYSFDFIKSTGCMDNLFYKLHYECNKKSVNKINKIEILNVRYNGNTIRISLKNSKVLDNLTVTRNNITKICENNDRMGSYHITLAYKYKDIEKENEDSVKREIDILNMLLTNQTMILDRPNLYHFKDMTSFNIVDLI